MSFLDLYQGDQDQAARIQPNEGHDLPSGFDENFHAAWSDGLLFSQSVARENARAGVLSDYLSEVRQKTGRDLSNEIKSDPNEGTIGPGMFEQVNGRVAEMKKDYPDLDLNPLSDDEIDNRALAKAQAAHRNYQTLQEGEKTAGGSFGSFLGSAAAGVADPINIVALPIAPEAAGIGILSTALRWGALAGVSQAAIEFASDDFKEQVQPGYTESGAPAREIGGAFLGGVVVGGTIKALGNAWSRVKTGQWPTSVRDAGNVIESEANIASTNPLPGVDGEVAHREALVKTIDDILAGRPVDVGVQVTPELQQAAAEAERAKGAVEQLQSMPTEQLPLDFEQPAAPKVAKAEGPQPVLQTADEMNKTMSAPDHQEIIRGDIDHELAERAAGSQNTPRATFTTAKGSTYSAFEDGTTIRDKAARPDVGHEGDSGVKDRSARTIYVDGDASVLSGAGLQGDVGGKGYRVAIKDGKATFLWWNEKEGKWGAPASGRDIPFSTKPEVGKSPVELWKPANDVPGHEAYRGQHAGNKIISVVEHPKPSTDFMVPGIDENGNHTMLSAKDAIAEVDRYKQAADEIQACAAPIQEAAE